MEHSGDRDTAFRECYRRYYRRLVRFFVSSFHVTKEDAEELAQETFVRFYSHMSEYRGAPHWAYLETVARRVAFNSIRDRHAQKRQGDVVPLDGPDALEMQDRIVMDGDPQSQFVDRLQRQKLSAAIQALPVGAREAVLLYIDGLSYEEIAKVLRLSIDAVKSRLRDARKTLRSSLKEE